MSLLTRRTMPLSSDGVADLPEHCRRCLFWELGAPRPVERAAGGRVDDEFASDPVVQKAAWVHDQELDRGAPGRIVRVDGAVAGWCLFAAPDAFAPRRAPVPRPSRDALLLATVWVEPQHRGGGIGHLLVQAAAKEALRRDRHAVEAYADRRHRDADCVLPSMWLLHEGFAVHREHPRYPLLRLDVRSLARWKEPLESAVEQALARLRRAPEPAPQRSGSPATGRDRQVTRAATAVVTRNKSLEQRQR